MSTQAFLDCSRTKGARDLRIGSLGPSSVADCPPKFSYRSDGPLRGSAALKHRRINSSLKIAKNSPSLGTCRSSADRATNARIELLERGSQEERAIKV